MEKKTKKLQLRKETIAVLNGERMAHVVGGNGVYECQNGGVFDGGQCICPSGFYGQYCEEPMDGETIIPILTYGTICEAASMAPACGSLEVNCQNKTNKTVVG